MKCDGCGGVWGGGAAQRSACMVVRRVRRPSGRGVQSRERRWHPDACMGFLQHRELLQLQRFWAGAAAQPLLPFVPPAMIDVAPGRRDMDKVIALHDSLNFPDNGVLQPVPYAGCKDYGPRRFKRADHCFVCEEFFGAFDDPARFAQRVVGAGGAAGGDGAVGVTGAAE